MQILLTRALSQSGPLQILLSKNGYLPVLFPSLTIKALNNFPRKNHYDALIFISANAVEYGLEVLKTLDYKPSKIFAVGAITAKKLEQQGIKVDAFPAQNPSSEALLAMDELQALNGKSVLIFRGEGGIETLKQGLEQNNSIEYIAVYRREISPISPLHQQSLQQFLQNDAGIITATSVENLTALIALVEKIDAQSLSKIKDYRLVVLSQRIKNFANSIGFNRLFVASKTSDDGLLEAIQSIS
ncbi:MAG: uroporphyrinogen-III synthase [Candidatus Thioglobus sp.]|nr:MAG: uroporphyrinogen-III synthase [Candidatus Thioglobus sp.]KAA0452587.1 MAG: uroporphyrinogen-III synthase [Candidatus Thioglobus sp.]